MYAVDNEDGEAQFAESKFGFVELEFTQTKLTIRFYGVQGKQLFLVEKV